MIVQQTAPKYTNCGELFMDEYLKTVLYAPKINTRQTSKNVSRSRRSVLFNDQSLTHDRSRGI